MTRWTTDAGAPPAHHVEFRCCDVVHYATPDVVHEGEVITAAQLVRFCTGCPEPANGLAVSCCVCRRSIACVYSRTTGEMLRTHA